MPNIFQASTDQTLDAIINCDSQDKLIQILGKKHYKKIIKKMPYFNAIKKVSRSFARTFIDALEMAETPVEILWITVGFASLGVATLWVLGGVGLIVSGLFLGYFYYHSNKKHEQLIGAINHVAMTEIQIHAMDELLHRNRPDHFKLNLAENKFKNDSVSYTKSIGIAASLILILGMTYWGVTDILFTVGVVSATSLLVSPIGLAIALGVAALIGVAFAIHYHYSHPKNNLVKATKEKLDADYHDREIRLNIFKQMKDNNISIEPIKINENALEQKENKLENGNNSLPKKVEFKPNSQNHRLFTLPMPPPALATPHKVNKIIRSQSF